MMLDKPREIGYVLNGLEPKGSKSVATLVFIQMYMVGINIVYYLCSVPQYLGYQ